MPSPWSPDKPVSPPPPAGLYVVGTPIGNLEDITLRALETLRRVDIIAAEDTRHTGRLLSRYGIRKKLISCHEHNEEKRAGQLIARVRSGEAVALVTDAGMPSVSDPGYVLVVAAIAAGLPVVPVPGVSAVTAALSVAGLPSDSFVFTGFPPRRTSRRRRFLADLSTEGRTLVLFESPRRILALLQDVRHVLGDRRVVLAREMTKRHEEFLRGTVRDVLQALGARQTIRGELTLLVAPDGQGPQTDDAALEREIAAALTAGLSVSEVARRASRTCGVSRNHAYRRALAMKTEGTGKAGDTSVE